MRKRKPVRHLAFAFFGLAALLVGHAAAQDTIGSATSLRNQVEGIIGQGSQPLRTGSEVYQNELVRTGDASVAQLVFLDNTDLSIGPKSEVTLDRFVYDPYKAAGSVVVRAGRGIFRFVTGSQRKQNYLILTPIASIGVRGTIFDLLVLPDRVTVILVEGEIVVTTFQGRVVALTEPGQSLTVFASGAVAGPRFWRGKVHVDFANAQFPYFGPAPAQPPARPAGPVVRHASISTEQPPRRPGGQVDVDNPVPRRPIDRPTWHRRHVTIDVPLPQRHTDGPTWRDRHKRYVYNGHDGDRRHPGGYATNQRNKGSDRLVNNQTRGMGAPIGGAFRPIRSFRPIRGPVGRAPFRSPLH